MRHTLKAVFDYRSDAQHVLDALLASGYSGADTALSAPEGLGASVRQTLARLFARPQPGQPEGHGAFMRGRHVVTLMAASDPDAERAIGIIERFAPVGVEDHLDESGQDDAGTDVQAPLGKPGGLHPAYPPGTAPGALQHRPHDDSRYFGIQRIDSPPIGNTFEESMGTIGRWDFAEEDSYPVRMDAYGGTSPDIDNDEYFRTHWNARYENDPGDGLYEDYLPAYMYGSEARRSEAYRNHHWDQVENELAARWEARHAGQPRPWERFKDAVQHGWNRIDLDKDSRPH